MADGRAAGAAPGSIVGGLQRMNLSLEQRLLLVSGASSMPVLRRRKTAARSSGAFRAQVGPGCHPKPKKDDRTTAHRRVARYGWRRVLWDAMPVDPLRAGAVRGRADAAD